MINAIGTRVLPSLLLGVSALLWAFQVHSETPKAKPASAATIAFQQQFLARLPRDDGHDQDFARRGFIGTTADPLIRGTDGHVVWNIAKFNWVKGESPDTVNPSLWRQIKLLSLHGLFKVTDGVWQVRGLDASNMLVVSGKTGWIIVDPLWSTETAAVAMQLIQQHLGRRPVSAVIYGHSHPDHYGGVRSVITPGTTPPIFAPEHMLQEIISEAVIAGNSSSRRTALMAGTSLPVGPRGNAGVGIIAGVIDGGTMSFIPPTRSITKTGETHVIDGVKFVFQMAPESEAPAELNLYLPETKTLYVGEMATCVMHNLQTPRGALVRDGQLWAYYLTEIIDLWGRDVENLVTGHCWPRFGNKVINEYLGLQRDNYKFIHDQTVRRFNNGETPLEIAEDLKRPATLENEWSNRDLYGTVQHNAKGVYQRYIGWWDGIPAHLNLHPPTEQGRRYVKAMGGSKALLKEARRAMAEGDYRWSADVLNHLVFAEPENKAATELLADSYEQMGYQAESSVWRNIYLVGAAELRGAPRQSVFMDGPDIVKATPMATFLSIIETRLDPQKIGDRALTLVINEQGGEKSLVSLRNGVIVSHVGLSITSPTVEISGTRQTFMALFLMKRPLVEVEKNGLQVKGDRQALTALLNAIEIPTRNYEIMKP